MFHCLYVMCLLFVDIELWVSYNILMRAVLLSTVAVDAFYDRYVCSKVWVLHWSRFQKEGLPTSNFPSLASFVFLESHHFVGAAPHGGGQQIKDCASCGKKLVALILLTGMQPCKDLLVALLSDAGLLGWRGFSCKVKIRFWGLLVMFFGFWMVLGHISVTNYVILPSCMYKCCFCEPSRLNAAVRMFLHIWCSGRTSPDVNGCIYSMSLRVFALICLIDANSWGHVLVSILVIGM